MATIEELRAEIERGRTAMRQAIETAAATWEEARLPGEGEEEVWTPRQTAEHAIGAETAFASMASAAIGGEPLERPTHVFETPEQALAAMPAAASTADAVFERVTAEHLGIETRFGDNLEGVMRIAGSHLRGHARQIMGLGPES